MPNEKITETFFDNGGPGKNFVNTLRIQWGAKGGAPDGWVNAGFAHIEIHQDYVTHAESLFVELDESSMDHLIRVLKRIRRKTFESNKIITRGETAHLRPDVSAVFNRDI